MQIAHIRVMRKVKRLYRRIVADKARHFWIVRKIQRGQVFIVRAVELVQLGVLADIDLCCADHCAVVILKSRADADIDKFKIVVCPDIKALHLGIMREIKLCQLVVERIIHTVIGIVERIKVGKLGVFAQIKLFESAGSTDKMFKLGELCHVKLAQVTLAALKIRKL